MTFKEKIGKRVSEFCKNQQEAVKSTSKEDKITFLQSKGWKRYEIKDEESNFWTDTRKIDFGGVGLDHAFSIELRNTADEQRKTLKKTGEAECFCVKCGKDCRKFDDHENPKFFMGYYGLIDATASGGYFSGDLSDGLMYTFSLCEKCLLALFEASVNLPEIEVYI